MRPSWIWLSLVLSGLLLSLPILSASPAAPAQAAPIGYTATLTGPAEFPTNTSPGTGFTQVDFDPVTHLMRVQVSFSGLLGITTASHIHACTADPLNVLQTAGVVTQTPTFVGFPLGVTSGTYDQTFNLLDPASYNPNFLTAQGGSVANAEATLAACLAGGQAYLNIHTNLFGGGEIRGFLVPAVPPTATPTVTAIPTATATPTALRPGGSSEKDQCKHGGYRNLIDPRTGQPFRNQGQCVGFFARGGD
jgi:hypothetical protein